MELTVTVELKGGLAGGKTTTPMVDEPEILCFLVEIESPKKGISSEKPLFDVPTFYLLSTAVCDA